MTIICFYFSAIISKPLKKPQLPNQKPCLVKMKVRLLWKLTDSYNFVGVIDKILSQYFFL